MNGFSPFEREVMAILLKLIICGFLLRLVGKAWACLGLGLIGNVWVGFRQM
jgi:hypothetical protein